MVVANLKKSPEVVLDLLWDEHGVINMWPATAFDIVEAWKESLREKFKPLSLSTQLSNHWSYEYLWYI